MANDPPALEHEVHREARRRDHPRARTDPDLARKWRVKRRSHGLTLDSEYLPLEFGRVPIGSGTLARSRIHSRMEDLKCRPESLTLLWLDV
jgi:hypothetical protein